MQLIGINGFKTSGKDTTFHIVAGIYNDGAANVQRAAFADKLKIMAARALGYLDLSDEDSIALMDDFKERGIIVAQMNQIGGNAMDETFMGDPSTIRVITGRQYLQWFGGEARKVFGDTFWIDQVLPQPWDSDRLGTGLEARYPDADVVCVTDVRYPNEAQRVRDLGGVVWEVIRPGLESDGHGSETPLPRDLVDVTINNDGSLADLERAVERALDAC